MDPFCRKVREDVLRISRHSGHGHIPTCFSVVEMLAAVYSVMRHDPANPSWDGRDIFILSKGHAALAHYCTLAHLGYFPVKSVYDFGAFSSTFGCHADRHRVPGVELSTGSLGHGSCVAAGMALALKIRRSARKVYVLVGDGESNEGTVWEFLMVAANRKLDNMVVLFDHNKSQKRCLPITRPADKFRAFDCDTEEVGGHDVAALRKALSSPHEGRPRVIVADTVKGYGCRTLEDDMFAWHRRSPSIQEMETLMGELG